MFAFADQSNGWVCRRLFTFKRVDTSFEVIGHPLIDYSSADIKRFRNLGSVLTTLECVTANKRIWCSLCLFDSVLVQE